MRKMSTARLASWDEMIQDIDNALVRIKEKFLVAFAEGQAEPDGRELIKQALFKTIWQKFAIAPSEFYELSDVDDYYRKIQRELLSYISDFSRRGDVKTLVGTLSLADPITNAKITMLRKICDLYYAFARNRFILSKLKNTMTAEVCETDIFVIEQESLVNESLLSELKVNSHLLRTISPLMHLNEQIISCIHDKGYGITAPHKSSNLLRAHDDGALFHSVIAQLDALPTAKELYDLMTGTAEGSKADRSQLLNQHIISLREARELLIVIRDDLLQASEKHFSDLDNEYNALLQIKNKIIKRDEFDVLFKLLFALKNSQELSDETMKPDFPVLQLAAREAVIACGEQSPTDNLFPFAKIGWNAASDTIKQEVNNIIKQTRVINAVFGEYRETYMAAIARVNKNPQVFKDLDKLIKGWGLVNARLRQTIDVVCDVLGRAEVSVSSSQQTTSQYLRGFLKRNAWFIAGGVLALSGAGAAVAFTVMTPIAAAGLIPCGAVLGGAGGAGIGIIKDHVKPPAVAAGASPLVLSVDHQRFDTAAMLRELFVEDSQISTTVAPVVIHKPKVAFSGSLTELDAQNDDLAWPEPPSYPARAVSMVPTLWKAIPSFPEAPSLPALPIPSLPSLPFTSGSGGKK
jgi:hypothetical protein